MKRIISALLCFILLLSICACNQSGSKQGSTSGDVDFEYNLKFSTKKKEIISKFATNDNSAKVKLSDTGAADIKTLLDGVDVDFPFAELYMTEECYNRLHAEVKVDKHKFSALNSSGMLDANHFLSLVKKNNAAYKAKGDFESLVLEEPSDDQLLQICSLIVDTINELKKQQPNIDYDRVYCNLGNLKIFFKGAIVANAHVTPELVMNINPNMFKIIDIMEVENGCRNTIIHEIMHVVQVGCDCEQIEHCTRRCGIAFSWDDFELNTSDLSWFFEASAERSMCNLTGDELFTYDTMVNYLCSLNLCTMFNENNPANYAETISFYSDIDMVFDMLGCDSIEDEYEALNLMIAINLIQTQPEEFMAAYCEKYNLDGKDQAVLDDFNCTLKPAVGTVFTKQFYINLSNLLARQDEITTNDLCYLVALFERNLARHTKYYNPNYDKYNTEFIAWYKTIRQKFFDVVKNDCGVDIATIYNSYEIFDKADETKVNASLKWNTAEKNEFLLERTDSLKSVTDGKVK